MPEMALDCRWVYAQVQGSSSSWSRNVARQVPLCDSVRIGMARHRLSCPVHRG
jgi:hypothetical protein